MRLWHVVILHTFLCFYILKRGGDDGFFHHSYALFACFWFFKNKKGGRMIMDEPLTTATVDDMGRILISSKLRKQAGLKAGDKVLVRYQESDNSIVIMLLKEDEK